MDHVSKALERAKAEHTSVKAWITPEKKAQALSPEQQPTAAQVALDVDVLRSHHVLCGPSIDDPLVTDRYRLLRTRVLQTMHHRGATSIGITSPGAKVGKTLTSINLAISIARESKKRVYLVDADLRQPAIARTLGLDASVGTIDYLASEMPLESIVVSSSLVENVMVIPGRPADSPANAPDYLRSERMAQLIGTLKRHGDSIVVVDLPPALLGDDVFVVAPILDALLLVIAEGVTNTDELKQTAALLADFNVIGSLLNNSSDDQDQVGGYYQMYDNA